ncbi:choice-of-anchor D domain-containing protein [Burkholderia ubonensis]|nr:choice-of-anchor D domain-containing protein [Burkholderia ubonensis]
MRHSVRVIAVALSALAAVHAARAAEYLVVVPVPGRTAQGVQVYLNPAQLPSGMVGQTYSGFDFRTALQVLGDNSFSGANVGWGVSKGTLPAGLSLSAVGVLGGVPLDGSENNGPFEVSATYKAHTASQTYSLEVQSAPVVIETPPAPAATGGTETISNGTANLAVSPTRLSFGDVARLIPTDPLTVKLENTGTGPAALAINPPQQSDFTLTHNCPASLAAGASCQATVVFNQPNVYTSTGSFSVALGQQAVTVKLDGTTHDSAATLAYTPKLVGGYQDLGLVAVGQFALAETTITNTSKYYALRLASASVSPPFAASNDCPAKLLPGEACTVTHRYAPTVEGLNTTLSRLSMNVVGTYRDYNLQARAAGDLTVTALSAPAALLPGGGALRLNGTGFLPGAKVYFGDNEAATTFNAPTVLTAIVPPVSAPETSWVKVVNPDGASATSSTPFARAKSFTEFVGAGPVDFGAQPKNVASDWKYITLKNSSYFPNESFKISSSTISGPFELDPLNSSCSAGREVSYAGGTCFARVRFKPTTSGDQQGQFVVNGDEVKTMSLMGRAVDWEGTPSGSGTENTEVPYLNTISSNEQVGGATQTKYSDIYFRNTNSAAQLVASFKLEKASVFKLYTVYKTSGTSPTAVGCTITAGSQTNLCTADLGNGVRPHLQLRLSMTSAPGPGTYTDTLIVSDATGKEQFRIPLTLDVVYNVSAEASSTVNTSTPVSGLTAVDVQLGVESYKDVFVRNVGTQGMLLTRSIQLVNGPAELYFKNGSVYPVSTANVVINCSATVTSAEMKNCLSDDISGGTYTHQRIRLYYKPTLEGSLSATLRVTHSGQGTNPIEIPVSISTGTASRVFSAALPTSPVTGLPTVRVSGNVQVDGTQDYKDLYVYLNKTGGTGNLYGYMQVADAAANKFILAQVRTVANNGTAGDTCTGSGGSLSAPCAASTSYPNIQTLFRAYSTLGLGTYSTKVSFLDGLMKEVSSVPINIEVANDATIEASSTYGSTVPFAGGQVDFGSATLATAPGQVGTPMSKTIYLRNTGTIGKLKVVRALIEGGNGAFSFPAVNPAFIVSTSSPSASNCGVTRVSAQEVTNCVTYDPAVYASNQHAGLTITYTPTAVGSQDATVTVWHTSSKVPNPLVIPLHATGVQNLVAGEPSTGYASTVAPTGVFSAMTAGTTVRDMPLYIRNPGSYGALYTEDISLSGASNFTIIQARKYTKAGDSGGNCGTIAGDQRSVTPCLADNADIANSSVHPQVIVRCTATAVGNFTGQLRVKTQGKEHLIPLSCSKTS